MDSLDQNSGKSLDIHNVAFVQIDRHLCECIALELHRSHQDACLNQQRMGMYSMGRLDRDLREYNYNNTMFIIIFFNVMITVEHKIR